MNINCRLKASSGCMQNESYVYPVAVDAGRIDAKAFVENLERNCKITPAMAYAVYSGTVRQLLTYLALGHTVEVPNLGVFSLDVKGKVVENRNGTKQIDEGKISMSFSPKSELKRVLEESDLKLVSGRVARGVVLTDEEAYRAACELLARHDSFMNHQFVEQTGVSRNQSYKILDRLVGSGLLKKDKVGGVNLYCRP